MAFTIDPIDTDGGRAEAILPLARVKRHVSVDAEETEFDDELALYRDAAVEAVEGLTGKLLSQETVTWRGDFPRWGGRLELARGPLVALTGITGLDSAGAAISLDPGEVTVRPGATWLWPVTSWPSSWRAGTVSIEFVAGYDDGNRPAALLTAALMLVAHYFLNREAVVTGTIGTEIPQGVESICRRYRDPVV